MMAPKGKSVLLGMSGGVDSSVAALALLEAGYDVEGVTLLLHVAPDSAFPGDAAEAREICSQLGIPHRTCDFSQLFDGTVVRRFCDGYLRGETPNPCFDCNKMAKFAALEKLRIDGGFDLLATGHYARCASNPESGRFELRRAADAAKDQTYFLASLGQDTLAHTVLPLGPLSKAQVRATAAAHGFANAGKAESQDICFVPDGDYAAFIERRAASARNPLGAGARRDAVGVPGDIVTRDGTVLGRHDGLTRYTVGQRKGIGVAYSEPLYVFAKDPGRNRLIVDTNQRTLCQGILVRDVNFVSRASFPRPERLTVKTHYRQTPRACVVEQTGERTARITFDVPQRACAPGQAAVVYDGESVAFGSTIDRSL